MLERKAIKRYLKKLTFQFLAFGAISAAVFVYLIPQHYFKMFPVVLLYFYSLNFFSYFILVKTHSLPTVKFSKYFMMLSLIKFFGSLIFVFLYIIFARSTVIPFLVIFITLYFHSLFQLVRDFQHFLSKKN